MTTGRIFSIYCVIRAYPVFKTRDFTRPLHWCQYRAAPGDPRHAYTDKQLLMVARCDAQCISLKAPDVTFFFFANVSCELRTSLDGIARLSE